MSKYGIPYMGSKDKIAEDILNVLPRGKRFVDLFGGGFAMSHAAALSGKYDGVYYNELNPLVVGLIKDALAGKFANERRWISREDFFRLRDIDGYVKYIWSFGNSGNAYMFGKDIEPIKKLGHDFCCFGKDIPGVPNIESSSIRKRRLYLQCFMKKHKGQRYELQQLEQLERLQQLERLKRFPYIFINCGSYLDYTYQDGDVIYCDPPYENTARYSGDGFDHKQFYNWVATRKYQVFFSSYDISWPGFFVVFKKNKLNLINNSCNSKLVSTEFLYCNRPYSSDYRRNLFEVKK